jgi:hypothetical protein
MGHPQLDNLARIGKLETEPAAETELRGLIRSGTRRLEDAAREDLSLEGASVSELVSKTRSRWLRAEREMTATY